MRMASVVLAVACAAVPAMAAAQDGGTTGKLRFEIAFPQQVLSLHPGRVEDGSFPFKPNGKPEFIRESPQLSASRLLAGGLYLENIRFGMRARSYSVVLQDPTQRNAWQKEFFFDARSPRMFFGARGNIGGETLGPAARNLVFFDSSIDRSWRGVDLRMGPALRSWSKTHLMVGVGWGYFSARGSEQIEGSFGEQLFPPILLYDDAYTGPVLSAELVVRELNPVHVTFAVDARWLNELKGDEHFSDTAIRFEVVGRPISALSCLFLTGRFRHIFSENESRTLLFGVVPTFEWGVQLRFF